MAAMRPSILQRFAGTPEIYREIEANRVALKEAVDHQNELTKTHRAFEGDILREIKMDVGEIKMVASETNGKVAAHDVLLGVIADREASDAIKKAARITKRQAIIVALCGAGAATIGLAIVEASMGHL
jgi:hypothetical protein